MAELAGFPEIGMFALLFFRARGKLVEPPHQHTTSNGRSTTALSPEWLLQAPPTPGHCGCSDPACGSVACYALFHDDDISVVLQALSTFDSIAPTHREHFHFSSRQILGHLSGQKQKKPIEFSSEWIPTILMFWETASSDDELRELPYVLQLLLVKLLYITYPLLAVESVVRMKDRTISGKTKQELATSHKSHHAYYVLIRAVIFGKRIKQRRPKSKFPIWDRMAALYQDEANDGSRVENGIHTLTVWQELAKIVSLVNNQSITRGRHDSPPFWFCAHGLVAASPANQIKPLYIVGDSHVLSLAWLQMDISARETPDLQRFLVPVVITGLKAWHVRPETRFFTRSNLCTMLADRLPQSQGSRDTLETNIDSLTIALSAGEIDCREGLGGPKLEGYKQSCTGHVHRTVQEYVGAVRVLSKNSTNCLQVLVMPVPPHADQSTGRVAGQISRRQATREWNEELRRLLVLHEHPSTNGLVYLLDYEKRLLAEGTNNTTEATTSYVLKKEFDADGTHMSCAFAIHFADAVSKCGCDLGSL